MEQIDPGQEVVLVETRQRFAMEDEAFYRMTAALDAWDAVSTERQDLPEARERYGAATIDLDHRKFNDLMSSLKQDAPLDPFATTVRLEECSSDLAASMAADSGLLRPQRGREQIEAELRGFEEDYVGFFADPEIPNTPGQAEHRQILRSISLFRSVLKPYVKELTGKNQRVKIEPYLDKLFDTLFENMEPSTMTSDAQQVVRLFGKYDIGGKLLWSNYDEFEHQRMREGCPPRFREDLDDFILVSYLCSGGAHTSERWFTDRTLPEHSPFRQHPAVLNIDQLIDSITGDSGTLDRFFMRSTPTGPLKLESATRRKVDKYLQCTDRIKALTRPYTQYAQTSEVWSRTLEVVDSGVYAKDIQRMIDAAALRARLPLNSLIEIDPETREALSLALTLDVAGSRGTPSGLTIERQVLDQMRRETGWPLRKGVEFVNEGDAYACIGVVPGYDFEQRPTGSAESNAMSLLERSRPDIAWQISRRLLYAAWLNDGEVFHNMEPVLVVRGTRRLPSVDAAGIVDVFSDVAASLQQKRYFGGIRALGAAGAGETGAMTFAQGS